MAPDDARRFRARAGIRAQHPHRNHPRNDQPAREEALANDSAYRFSVHPYTGDMRRAVDERHFGEIHHSDHRSALAGEGGVYGLEVHLPKKTNHLNHD